MLGARLTVDPLSTDRAALAGRLGALGARWWQFVNGDHGNGRDP